GWFSSSFSTARTSTPRLCSCRKVAHKVCSNHHGQMEVAVLLVSLLEQKYSYSRWRSTQLCKLGNDRSFLLENKNKLCREFEYGEAINIRSFFSFL
ncbi:unnamed protein product, partial [Musa acuminata subsp. burmannicoides]